MVSYNLDHLTQPDDQFVAGPIQDDEALFIFAMIRCMRLETVLEIGGHQGYSATNFLKAVGPKGRVYTVDIVEVPKRADNHYVVLKDCRTLTKSDIRDETLDLVFYDCHDYFAQMEMHQSLVRTGAITDKTILLLHDTNLHASTLMVPNMKRVSGGFVHQPVERAMVNVFRNEGYEALNLHTTPNKHDDTLPVRHGLTVLTKNRYLEF